MFDVGVTTRFVIIAPQCVAPLGEKKKGSTGMCHPMITFRRHIVLIGYDAPHARPNGDCPVVDSSPGTDPLRPCTLFKSDSLGDNDH